jgi:hypothetical protein
VIGFLQKSTIISGAGITDQTNSLDKKRNIIHRYEFVASIRQKFRFAREGMLVPEMDQKGRNSPQTSQRSVYTNLPIPLTGV